MPAFAIRALYGGMAKLVVEGQNARPRRTTELGYRFQHPDLDEALRSALATLDHHPPSGSKVGWVTPNAGPDRYEPLPGLVGIPGFLIRKIPPRARRPAAIGAAIVLAAAIVALVLSIPAITDTKEDRAAAEHAGRAGAARRAHRDHRGPAPAQSETGTAARGLTGAAALEARHALVDDLDGAVHDDAVSRVQAGELTQTVARVECERFPRAANGADPADDLSQRTARYSCLAITADAPRVENNEASSIGYPYRALVDFPSGRFTYCKITGRPGEGSIPGATADPRPARLRRRGLTHRGDDRSHVRGRGTAPRARPPRRPPRRRRPPHLRAARAPAPLRASPASSARSRSRR